MRVSKIKEIHARVTEFCSGNENGDAVRTNAGEATPIPPPHWARDKKLYELYRSSEESVELLIPDPGALLSPVVCDLYMVRAACSL